MSATIALALTLASCAGAQTRVNDARWHAPIAVAGSVHFEARAATPRGLSESVESRPARSIVIRVLDRDGRALVQTRTAGDGTFRVQAPGNAAFVEALAQSGDLDLAVTRDAAGEQVHALRVNAGREVAIVARDAEGSFAGALHLLETLRRGLDSVSAWSGRSLPPLYAYWDRGVTREWSFYRGERPAGSGRFCVELMGGDPGAQATSDTDEHDEAIVLHELGHFVMDRLTGDSSLGGMHPRGALIDPGLAWEEGRATWFATAVLGAPAYRDTIGVEPHGRVRVDESLETPLPPRGIGSETSVAGVLWDLADGDGVLPDDDADGVALGAAAVLGAMISLASTDGAFPSLPSFLRHLVGRGLVAEEEVHAMLGRTGEPLALLPPHDAPAWPLDLVPGASAQGKVDGLTQPAPSGGANRPDTGFDAIRTYRVRVERRSLLSVRLVIHGSGSASDQTDLDLELRDQRARVLDSARGNHASEAVARVVEPGWYLIYVRDAGGGNRADFELQVGMAPR